MLHRVIWHIVQGCYTVSSGTKFRDVTPCRLAHSSGMLHRVIWHIVQGCYTLSTGTQFRYVTPCRLARGAILVKERDALFLRTSRILCRLTLKIKAPRSFETSTVMCQSSRSNIKKKFDSWRIVWEIRVQAVSVQTG